MRMKYFLFMILISINHCALGAEREEDITSISEKRASELKRQFQKLLEKHNINTIGVSVIKSGEIVWIEHFGEQSPGVPASRNTMFNIASLTKTITAETILILAQKQKLSLDESMSSYWVDPDISKDERHLNLTPRMALTHSTGLPNWRFFTSDKKLKIIDTPGKKYRYSGEGFQYLAKFAEKKLGVPFEDLVKTYVFKPVGMNKVSLSVRKENFPNIARAKDANGKFYGHYCRPEGWCSQEGTVSVAGDMVITVEDYSKFLIWSMRGKELNTQLRKKRGTIQVDQEIFKGFKCEKIPTSICPTRQGFGLGWNITQFNNRSLIGHGGSDWSQVTLAYYYPRSNDGLVIFLNAPNELAMAGIISAIKLLDPDSPKLHEYRFRLDR